jgi:hypothetical protein
MRTFHRTSTRRRSWAAAAWIIGCLLLPLALLPPLAGLATADASPRSPCEDGRAVGQLCHYVAIVSEGPDYDASMSMLYNSTGAPVAGTGWHEHNPRFTRWYWRYDQAWYDQPDIHLHLRIVLRGALTGLDTDLPGGRDSCYQISADAHADAVKAVDCPQTGIG